MYRFCLILLIFCLWTSSLRTEEAFPRYGILPKTEIGALDFLEQFPAYDGTGVTVAVFDTGVDPGAPGLQTTPDGRPKIVDIVDGSGSGDVRTDTIREAIEFKLKGLTGRELRVSEDWNNPTGKYHLGMKAGYELFPGRAIPRLRGERRKEWDIEYRKALDGAQRELKQFEDSHQKINREQKKHRDELAQRVKQLRKLASDWEDPGPIYDCVVFHDGGRWRAVVDTKQDGDLTNEKVLTNYRDQHEHGTFGEEDLVDFTVNIYEDGNLLSIVTDAGTHGTHVAGIVAAHYPDRPELNGIAPGAQIVSVKIGDTRIGSNSLGTGQERGLIAVLENKCDLINMSYGGASPSPNEGALTDLYTEIVQKHGVIFLASAGNSGPALSTVGSPGGTTSAIIGVGAYVSPEMMEVAYSLREKLTEMPFTWSSRGPALDGDLGVDICAPGGAIAPVSRWSLSASQLMNGTSMSSPNACGGLALILSGLKDKKIDYSPELVKTAIMNTARPLADADPFSMGRGLLQVSEAFEWLEQNQGKLAPEVRFDVSLPNLKTKRGIYLREREQVTGVLETPVRVSPVFHEDVSSDTKANYQVSIRLECESIWVETPKLFYLYHGGRDFQVFVDPGKLEPGVHYTEVVGYDANHRELGPLFRVPITVVKPKDAENQEFSANAKVRPGEITRHFITVPDGATWADISLRMKQSDTPRMLVLHTLERLEDRSFTAMESRQYLRLEPDERKTTSIAVTGGRTMELTIAQFWSSLGQTDYELDVKFNSILPSDRVVTFDTSQRVKRVDVLTMFGSQRLKPEAEIDTWRRKIPPKTAEIAPLTIGRDQLPDERHFYGLTLSYEFSLDERAKVSPRTPAKSDEFGSQLWSSGLWMIYDKHKQILHSGVNGRDATLDKGDYTLKLFLRHLDTSQLESIRELPLWLDIELKSKKSVPVARDYEAAWRGRSSGSTTTLDPGAMTALFVGAPASLIPKGAEAGDILIGRIHYGESRENERGAGRKPGGYPLRIMVSPPIKLDDSGPKLEEDKSEPDTLDDKLFATKLGYLREQAKKKEREQEKFDQLANELLEAKPDHLPVLQTRLEALDGDDRKKHLPEVVKAADAIIKTIPLGKVERYFGTNQMPESPEEKKLHQEMTEKRDALIDALYRKARAIAYMDLPPDPENPEPKDMPKRPRTEEKRDELFEKTFKQLAAWVDTTDPKYALVHIRRLRRQERPAEALDVLNQLISKEPTNLLFYKKRADIYGELGWDFAVEHENQWRKLRQRPDYQAW